MRRIRGPPFPNHVLVVVQQFHSNLMFSAAAGIFRKCFAVSHETVVRVCHIPFDQPETPFFSFAFHHYEDDRGVCCCAMSKSSSLL